MSIYSDCAQAISDLAELSDVFTEADVWIHASRDGWTTDDVREARKYANQIISARYRNGEVVRYGPVEYSGVQDYARKAGSIVYAGTESGPVTWSTPNGEFPRLPRHEDEIQSGGRRKGTARSDDEPWSEQPGVDSSIRIVRRRALLSVPEVSDEPAATPEAEIERLTALLAKAHQHSRNLEDFLAARDEEIARLHREGVKVAKNATHLTVDAKKFDEALGKVVAHFDERFDRLEEGRGSSNNIAVA